MKCVLDELADASPQHPRFSISPRIVVTSLQLRDQFAPPLTPRLWQEIGSKLACILPPLKRLPQGRWTLPNRCQTVGALGNIVVRQHSDWVLPSQLRETTWREAQVFAGVRATLIEALNVDPEEVVRTARLQADLGAE